MNDIEKGAWAEALQFAFEQAELNKHEWSKARQFKNYAIRNGKELYPNKIIYGYCLDFLKENYSTLFDVEIGIETGVGIKLNTYLAQKGADTVIIDQPKDNHHQFKKLLAYFVSHLEWTVNKDESFVGFNSYIKPLINSKGFKSTGQGYAGDRIQDQIKDWEKYDDGDIKINIQASFGNYKTVKSYLNWKGTGINIVARWNNNSIISLYQEEYFYMETPKRRVNLGFEITLEKLELFNQSDINENLISFYNSFVENFKKYKNKVKRNNLMNTVLKHKNLLEYKKQIILQGPPGTGKTRLAKEIAQQMIGNFENKKSKPLTITKEEIKKYIKPGITVSSVKDKSIYTVSSVNDVNVKVKLSKSSEYSPSYSEIVRWYNDQKWNKGEQIGGTDPYSAALAKYIYENIQEIEENISIEDSEQFKLIQFHPSYTYEDFVRGIVAKPNDRGDGIVYEAENKMFADFAQKALENYIDSQKDEDILSYEKWVDTFFEKFVDYIRKKLTKEKTIDITERVNIVSIDEDAFRYKGKKGWSKLGNRMLFEDIIKAIIDKNATRQQLKSNSNLSGLAKWHASYYIRVVDLFNDFITENDIKYEATPEIKIDKKNYVIVIDEINRANLSSVLGELIYALEYRGKYVESMYEVNGNNELILPPNLYIIGTMNTADRSVGHIDYAIRRRFAFIDILPKELKDNTIVFHKDIFRKVSELFIKNYNDYNADEKISLKRAKTLSAEFRPEDVWIGHSYFIQKKLDDDRLDPQDFRIRVDYEIKPILLEYVKDGVLTGKVNEMDIEDYIKSL